MMQDDTSSRSNRLEVILTDMRAVRMSISNAIQRSGLPAAFRNASLRR
jgi:hypothetical protein